MVLVPALLVVQLAVEYVRAVAGEEVVVVSAVRQVVVLVVWWFVPAGVLWVRTRRRAAANCRNHAARVACETRQRNRPQNSLQTKGGPGGRRRKAAVLPLVEEGGWQTVVERGKEERLIDIQV